MNDFTCLRVVGRGSVFIAAIFFSLGLIPFTPAKWPRNFAWNFVNEYLAAFKHKLVLIRLNTICICSICSSNVFEYIMMSSIYMRHIVCFHNSPRIPRESSWKVPGVFGSPICKTFHSYKPLWYNLCCLRFWFFFNFHLPIFRK